MTSSTDLKAVIIIVFAFVNVALFAQDKGTFNGVIKEKQNDEVIIGAHVVLLGNLDYATVTNFNGEFSIEAPVGKQFFVISFVGMQNDTLEVEIDKNVTSIRTVYLSSAILDEFEVRVGSFDTDIADMTISMEVIKPDLIENKNTRSVETILDQTPGLNVMDGEPQIRGGSGFTFGVGSKVAILVDGMPMLSGDAGRPLWDFVPVENIQQIEVIKGAASVLSGASALSGAIHIKTAEPGIKPLTKVNVYSGFYSAPQDDSAKWWGDEYPYIHGMNFLHSRKIGNLDFVLGGLVNLDHGYIGAPTPGPFVFDTVTNFGDTAMTSEKFRANIGLRYHPKRLSNLTFGVNANAMYHNTNLTLAWLDDTAGIFRGYPGGVMLQKQLIYNIDPYVNLFTKNGAKHAIKMRSLVTDNEMSNNQSNSSTYLYGDYQFKHTLRKINDLNFVVGATATKILSISQIYVASGDSNNTIDNYSGYIQLDKKVKEVLTISFGYRGEYYELNTTQNDLATILRAGLNLKLTEGTNLRASYGQGYRYPTIAERFIKTTVGTFGVFDNPDLLPETSWNVELGLRQGYKLGNLVGYVDVVAFHQEYKNTIEYLFGFWDPTFTFAWAGFKFLNTGDTEIIGIDASSAGMYKTSKNSKFTYIIGYNYILPTAQEPDKVFAKDFSPGGSGEFSYNSTSSDSTGNILKYRFLHTFKADAEYVFRDKFAIGASGRYYSRIQNLDKAIIAFEQATANTGGTLQEVRYSDFYEKNNKGNLIIDARVSYTLNQHKLALVVSNLMNKTYSLRPLKIEPMRTIMLQYSLKI